MEQIERNVVLIAQNPYGITWIVLTVVQFALIWVVSFYTEGNLSQSVLTHLDTQVKDITCPQRQSLVSLPNVYSFCTEPASYLVSSRLRRAALGAEKGLYEPLAPHDPQTALFMLGFPHPMEGQTFVVIALVFSVLFGGHLLTAEVLTGRVLQKIGRIKLCCLHVFFAVLFFVCALLESVYAAGCGSLSKFVCNYALDGDPPTFNDLMAICACPLMESRIYATLAFFWIFAVVHGVMAFFVFQKMDFRDETKESLFHFEFFFETRIYGKLLLLPPMLHLTLLWVASFFVSNGSYMISDSTPVSGFVLGSPQWANGQTVSVVAAFLLFWISFEFLFWESLTGAYVSRQLGLNGTRLFHGAMILLLTAVASIAVAYLALYPDFLTYFIIREAGNRAVGCLVLALLGIVLHAVLIAFAKELFPPTEREVPTSVTLELAQPKPVETTVPAITVTHPRGAAPPEEQDDPAQVEHVEPKVKAKKHVTYDDVPRFSTEVAVTVTQSEGMAPGEEESEPGRVEKIEKKVKVEKHVTYDEVPRISTAQEEPAEEDLKVKVKKHVTYDDVPTIVEKSVEVECVEEATTEHVIYDEVPVTSTNDRQDTPRPRSDSCKSE